MSATPESLTPAEEISGAPASVAAVEAQGLARWLHSPAGISATGDRIASPAGQVSWAMYEWARNPYVLLITIYLFSPYFAEEVVGDSVKGQGLAGAIQAYSGIIIAVLAPFLGAIADCGGRRKPWIATARSPPSIPQPVPRWKAPSSRPTAAPRICRRRAPKPIPP